MKINFDASQGKQKIETEKNRTVSSHTQTLKNAGAESKYGLAVDFSGKAGNQQIYGKQGKSLEDLKNETGVMDAASYKNYMAVMSNSMSEEDFAALIQDGVKPGKVEVRDAVTIMDHIKAAMAQSGNVIAGFNGEGDISMDKLEAMAGDNVSAQSILASFQENDIPLTEENIKQVVGESSRIADVTDFTDGMKQYLLENELEPTSENLYKAQFSTSEGRQGGTSGYFMDDLSGYYGKKPEDIDITALENQMEKVIKEAGLSVCESTKQEASWLLEKGILLTPENMKAFDTMNQLTLPMEQTEVISHIAQALGEGKTASQANLAKPGIVKQAEQLVETVAQISEEAVKQVVSEGEDFTIRNLARVQRELTEGSTGNQIVPEMEHSLLHAQRILEETRLSMTVSANILLLKSDYSIETAQLEQLVDNLRQMEEQSGKTYGITLPDSKNNTLFQETMEKTQQLRDMPATVLWDVGKNRSSCTLNQIYEQGTTLKATYDKAGESYEALMTKPRADLGDRIRDAFSNIPELLEDAGMENTKDNQRAVRILAYNQMEITKENIVSVREADQMLSKLLGQMSPTATLKMIRDGVNPLEENVAQLSEYMSSQEEEFTQETERFSKFLYKLDQEKTISQEERESYLGIYRLIRQIEKGDGKAIGTVIANGQELSFSNLLSAVRTSQKKNVNTVIDDNFGVLTDVNQKGVSISDQIESYYVFKASSMLDKLEPKMLTKNKVSMDTTWEEIVNLTENAGVEEEAMHVDREYNRQEFEQLREAVHAPETAVQYLLSNGQTVTIDNLLAAKEMVSKRGEVFRTVRDISKKKESRNADTVEPDFDSLVEKFTSKESAADSYEDFTKSVSEMLDTQMLSGNMDYLDIRALASVSKQLSLANNMAKQENYELAAIIDGELTSVNVHFQRDREQNANVRIQVGTLDEKKILAEFRQAEGVFSGYIGCNNQELVEHMQQKLSDFSQKVLSETGKETDINIVYSEDVITTYTGNNDIKNEQTAGKQMLTNNISQSEEAQGSHTSAKELYSLAKEFIKLLEAF